MNLINELGELALSTRLVRLSEMARKDVTRIYKEHHLNFESKWFPVLYVLHQKKSISIIELADEIGYSHPSVIALIKEMQKEKLLKSALSKSDGRKRIITLTAKAENMIEEFQPLWDNFRKVATQIYNNGSSLLKAVEDTEAALAKESYYDRYKKIEAKNSKKKK